MGICSVLSRYLNALKVRTKKGLYLLAVLPQLGPLNLQSDSVTFSGVSSGAFMSVQMQVIYSDLVVGAASISGGVFWCAKGSALTAQID